MPESYYSDDTVTLYCGDMREVLPALDIQPDLVVADPPYQATSLAWDRWPDGWPTAVAAVAASMWSFGSMRMFLDRRDEFAAWRLSQDIVWEKRAGSGAVTDRLTRVHEHVLHWYRGPWATIHHQVPLIAATPEQISGHGGPPRSASGGAGRAGYAGRNEPWRETGMRMLRSVIRAPNLRGRASHPTEKPVELLRPLIEYGCPPGGLVLDPFAGSGSTANAARQIGRRSVLIEADERYCHAIALRLAQDVLPLEMAQ